MSQKFYLDKTKEYLIYGAGGGGLKLIPVFERKGYNLKGFIDKRAGTLGDIQGYAVWSLNSLKELADEAENIIVVITTKNVFDHSSIVYELAEMGFRQCIYKPLPVLKGYVDQELEKISKAHDIFLIEKDIPKPQELCYVRENYKMYCKDRLLISQRDMEVLAWMPLELLFNYEKLDAYENLSMAAFFPLENLYRLFLGNIRGKEEILEDFNCYSLEWAHRNKVKVDGDLKKSWLESRRESFSQMQEIADYDFDFFYRNAPWIESGESGKFHMVRSGRNRVVFLAAKGYHSVPVKMMSEDYEKWINRAAFIKIQNYVEQERIVKFTVPVAHPYLKDITSERVDYYRLVCFPIAKYIIRSIYCCARRHIDGYYITDKDILNEIKDKYSILCDLNDGGACSRYLNMCGFRVGRVRNDDKLTRLLDELFYQNSDVMDNDTGDYKIFITDNIAQIDEAIEVKNIDIIINIGLYESEKLNLDGYVYEQSLSEMFDIDGVKMVDVFRKRIV